MSAELVAMTAPNPPSRIAQGACSRLLPLPKASPASRIDGPEDRLLTAVKKAEQATQHVKDEALASVGISKAEYKALLILSAAPGVTSAATLRPADRHVVAVEQQLRAALSPAQQAELRKLLELPERSCTPVPEPATFQD
jgi:hypothetical protein